MLCWVSVLPRICFLSKSSIVKERQIYTQDFRPCGRLSLRQCHGYTHFVVLMEPQAYSKWINLHSRSQNLLSFFIVYRLSFLVRLMRIGKLIFWHKSQPLHSLNLEVLQRKSNRPTRFFLFSGGKPSIRAKMLNGNLPLHAKFLLSQCH